MFGTDKNRVPQETEQYDSFGKKFNGNPANVTQNLNYVADLGSGFDNGLCWQILPGVYDMDSFCSSSEFHPLPAVNGGSFVDVATLRNRYCGYFGTTWEVDQVTGTLAHAITGCCYGGFGAWFTADSDLYLLNSYGNPLSSTTHANAYADLADVTFGIESDNAPIHYHMEGLTGLCNPVEYNGYLFMTAHQEGACMPVVAYQPPTIDPDPLRPAQFQYFSIEDLGEVAVCGVHKGQLVVATNRGVWQIEPDHMHSVGGEGLSAYHLGQQIAEWSLSYQAQIAVGFYDIAIVDKGDLYIYDDAGTNIYPQSRFTAVRANGTQLVLSGAAGIAVSNGDGFETYDNYTAVGMALYKSGGGIYMPDRMPLGSVGTVILKTNTAHYPGVMAIKEIAADQAVTAISIVTENGTYALQQSIWNDKMWLAGYGGKHLQILMTVPQDEVITTPTIRFEPRSRL